MSLREDKWNALSAKSLETHPQNVHGTPPDIRQTPPENVDLPDGWGVKWNKSHQMQGWMKSTGLKRYTATVDFDKFRAETGEGDRGRFKMPAALSSI
jgi:hypothetical protein